ncbi:MAG: histidine kinase [Tissierellia bacterium]|nr:histidine kinase [Tissierellia bacterium]
MRDDIIELTIPSKPDYISVARLTSSVVGNNMGFNIDDIEDIKVSIAEACINALNKDDKISIGFEVGGDKLVIRIDNVFPCKDTELDMGKEIELGLLIIESLMDEVEFGEEGIKMIKYVEDGI